ncbi:hypothetical protein C8R44DRAFT_735633 [Mycena epipterygia]|nr:hypothetical protein C8R44DRAFT_735633 [Mycena epipterygia]
MSQTHPSASPVAKGSSNAQALVGDLLPVPRAFHLTTIPPSLLIIPPCTQPQFISVWSQPAMPLTSGQGSESADSAVEEPAPLAVDIFLYDFLAEIGFVGWYTTLEAIGMVEGNLYIVARLDESCRDDLIANLVPWMSIMDRAILGDAIHRLTGDHLSMKLYLHRQAGFESAFYQTSPLRVAIRTLIQTSRCHVRFRFIIALNHITRILGHRRRIPIEARCNVFEAQCKTARRTVSEDMQQMEKGEMREASGNVLHKRDPVQRRVDLHRVPHFNTSHLVTWHESQNVERKGLELPQVQQHGWRNVQADAFVKPEIGDARLDKST